MFLTRLLRISLFNNDCAALSSGKTNWAAMSCILSENWRKVIENLSISHLCHLLWICLPLHPTLQLLCWLHWRLYLQSHSGFNHHIRKCWILGFCCTYHFPLAFLLFEDYRSASKYIQWNYLSNIHFFKSTLKGGCPVQTHVYITVSCIISTISYQACTVLYR